MVGGGLAGIITDLTAKSVYPEKSVCIIKDIGDSVIPCAISYMMKTMKDPKQNVMGNQPLEKAGIKVVVAKVVSLDTKERTITLESGEVLSYERLVLVTGTVAVLLGGELKLVIKMMSFQIIDLLHPVAFENMT